MLMRGKSEKKKREEAEIIELLKHMHQLDRNELIARTQQRDQYIICIIGAIIAFLIGLIQIQGEGVPENISLWILLGCLVAWLLMTMMTYRLVNSYDIHDQLIAHTKEIDTAFKEKYHQALPVGVSQILCKHRRAVKNRAKNIYWGGGLSATPWIQYRQRIACMSRAAAGKPLFTLPLICMQLSVNQAFCPQNKRPSERGSCSSPVACPSIFL